ncbi:hypothetical protein BCON_0129g00150 [Botryotinia convoluta]|uniref:Protein kinase domain-containing protein n=1 Tax=Botryotinia convoluta TaxID=54673 RepID=A0A4Z1I859_9HELO|nr:hypothetical protein BCON_0129g00150 [Botryotinia convoluta]
MEQIFVFKEVTFMVGDPPDDDKIIRITMRCLGASFIIVYGPAQVAISPYLLAQHEESLGLVKQEWERGENGLEHGNEISRLLEPFREIMNSLAPNPIPSIDYLSDYLYMPHLVLEATAEAHDSLVIKPYFKGQLPAILAYFGYSMLERFWKIHPNFRGLGKVIDGDGTICYFKRWGCTISKVGFGKPWIHNQISAAIDSKKLRSDIPICRLHSMVVDEIPQVRLSKEEWIKWDPEGIPNENSSGFKDLVADDDPDYKALKQSFIFGVLFTYIENKGTLEKLAPSDSYSGEDRHRWAREIEGIVQELHATGIVWGNVSPENILVGLDDRLWLINLDDDKKGEGLLNIPEDGSRVPQWPRWLIWVEYEKKCTFEGDLKGVERIKMWLRNCARIIENPYGWFGNRPHSLDARKAD